MTTREQLFSDWIEAERKALKAERLLSDESTRDRWSVTSSPSAAHAQAMLRRAQASEKLRLVMAEVEAAAKSIRMEWAQRPPWSHATTGRAALPRS